MNKNEISNKRVLVTGGAGFIGTNLCKDLIEKDNQVICLDNFSTGYKKNIENLLSHKNFTLIEGDIRDIEVCNLAVENVDYVLHHAALGSVPRSINDPLTTNSVNIEGFLNMLIASRDKGIKRFVYAASSSTYGDSVELPKIEHRIGRPLSPYAITKYVNELYAKVFTDLYGIETIGLRYFNVFGEFQSPKGAYAAVIPLWVQKLLQNEQPVINGDGSFSRDFTYIKNVIHANHIAATTPGNKIFERAKYYNMNLSGKDKISLVFNIAYGANTTLLELFHALRNNLSKYDSEIGNINPKFGPERPGDIPHSQASVLKASRILGYSPQYDAFNGFAQACEWYYHNLK